MISKFKKKPTRKIINKYFKIYIFDNFLEKKIAKKISKSFFPYSSNIYLSYENPAELKKTCNDWNSFPKEVYEFYHSVNSNNFSEWIKDLTDLNINLDIGLHGGGMHIHKKGGYLNPHVDYLLHPKIKQIRKYNLILYIDENYKKEYGGNLGFWLNKNGKLKLEYEIEPLFNRMVLFDTENVLHGLSNKFQPKKKCFRKSLAAYYTIEKNIQNNNLRQRAKFFPRENQKIKEFEEFSKKRSNKSNFKKYYIVK
tara:strand:- start:40 stop:798 length:759 start_codon:yes stop_codon:yes gene_type:complete